MTIKSIIWNPTNWPDPFPFSLCPFLLLLPQKVTSFFHKVAGSQAYFWAVKKYSTKCMGVTGVIREYRAIYFACYYNVGLKRSFCLRNLYLCVYTLNVTKFRKLVSEFPRPGKGKKVKIESVYINAFVLIYFLRQMKFWVALNKRIFKMINTE